MADLGSLIKNNFTLITICAVSLGAALGYNWVQNQKSENQKFIQDLNNDSFYEMIVKGDTLYSHYDKISKSIKYDKNP